eukprot:scaffold78734_cov69-Phaeocystis_antarctica.AAC.2
MHSLPMHVSEQAWSVHEATLIMVAFSLGGVSGQLVGGQARQLVYTRGAASVQPLAAPPRRAHAARRCGRRAAAVAAHPCAAARVEPLGRLGMRLGGRIPRDADRAQRALDAGQRHAERAARPRLRRLRARRRPGQGFRAGRDRGARRAPRPRARLRLRHARLAALRRPVRRDDTDRRSGREACPRGCEACAVAQGGRVPSVNSRKLYGVRMGRRAVMLIGHTDTTSLVSIS